MNGNNSKQQDEEVKYPYLVVRQISGFYTKAEIAFLNSTEEKPVPRTLSIVCQQPYVDGELTDTCKQALVEVVKHETRRTQYRMCLVLGERECIYVEPDGTTQSSEEPPSLTIRLPSGETFRML